MVNKDEYITLISFFSFDHHLYADDSQLFFSFHPFNFDSSISHLQDALLHISSCMTVNLLTLISSKTEFLLIGLKNQLAKIHNSSLDTSHSARNIGFIFDKHLTFSDQITSLSKTYYYYIRPLHCIRPYFGSSTVRTIATSVVHSKLDYCNSLYNKLPSRYYPVSSRSRTLMLLSLKLPSSVISHPSYTLSTGCRSLNVWNTSSSHLPTKFSQLPNLHTFITSSPLNVLAVLALHPSLLLLGHLHHPL